MNILIVDEDSETVEKLGGLLRGLGHKVLNREGETCLSEDGLSFDATRSPDVVFLDVDNTLMRGVDALEPIAQSHPGAKIVLTTRGAIADVPSCDRALGVFSKPLRLESLRRLMNHMQTVYFDKDSQLSKHPGLNRLERRFKTSARRQLHSTAGQVRILLLQVMILGGLIAAVLKMGF